tara:strand:+ start:592 stop:1314 length:723 start_codon:yes stop_codon:yes gene_type:complete
MEYILQKGYIRTCTNYARVLLEKNFDCKVITVAKHNDVEGLYENMEDYIALVKEQRGWPQNLEPELIQELYNNKKLKYSVCIKNPYSWFHSVSKTGPSMHRPDLNNPWPVIGKFNERYKRWVDIIEKNKGNSYIFRHEDLMNSFEDTFADVHNELQLTKALESYSDESRDVLGQHKGQKRIGHSIYSQRFNIHAMPLLESGIPALGISTFDRIRKEVDWQVMEYYGYSNYNKDYDELYGI